MKAFLRISLVEAMLWFVALPVAYATLRFGSEILAETMLVVTAVVILFAAATAFAGRGLLRLVAGGFAIGAVAYVGTLGYTATQMRLDVPTLKWTEPLRDGMHYRRAKWVNRNKEERLLRYIGERSYEAKDGTILTQDELFAAGWGSMGFTHPRPDVERSICHLLAIWALGYFGTIAARIAAAIGARTQRRELESPGADS